MQSKLKIAFINPPHANWSLANNITFLMMQSHYNHHGKYPEQVLWLDAPYKFDQYQDISEIYNEIAEADVYLFSSYVWNYDLCDELSKYIKNINPNSICILGGPHIGTNNKSDLQKRNCYDYICLPTKPGEVFMEDFINLYIENNKTPEQENISWELNSKKTKSCAMPNYSIYEEHYDYLKKINEYSLQNNLESFIVLETTRGCPYKCVFCEWGGGIDTKILKKDLDVVKRDILAMKHAGYTKAYLTDANFGAFEDRDLEIFKFAWENNFDLSDISTFKAKDLNRRKRLIDKWFDIVGSNKTRCLDIEVPNVCIQSISDEAMHVAKRVDLSTKDKIELSYHIRKKCIQENLPAPALELILAMPGSTLDDFYKEMELIYNFKSWSGVRHDYMILPDSHLSNLEYLKQYNIVPVKVYTDLVDEDEIDNVGGIYKNRKTYFETVSSCYSFTRQEMCEMWFMNHAGNKLLETVYHLFEDTYTPGEFCKECFCVIRDLPGFCKIYDYIYDLLDPQTTPKNIKKINGIPRNKIITDFVQDAKPIIISELSVKQQLEKGEEEYA